MREEGNSLLLGTYEKGGVPWSTKTTPWDFEAQLLTPDLERIAESLDVGFSHFPIFNEIGIRQTINGPFTFAPDGNPLIGPVRSQPGHWLACGVMAGLSQGGGVGLAMANWITTGDPGFDVWGMDHARFGDWATPVYTNAKVRENYGRRFTITFPNEELRAARPHLTSPLYGRLQDRNAVFGASYGLEQALWFQRAGEEPFETPTFRRSNAFSVVAEEVAAVRAGVGLMEITGYAKYEFAGPGARGFLDGLLANWIPPAGRLALSPMLNHEGRLIGDFTVGALSNVLGDERFLVFGSGPAQHYHERWFREQIRLAGVEGSVSLRVHGNDLCGLSVAGPASREVLSALVDVDLDEFPFLSFTEAHVGAVPVLFGRISFTGDLGYELWCAPDFAGQLFDLVSTAGEGHGMRLFGGRALNSLRLDKGWGAWATEYRPIYDPYEANMGWMVRLDKSFIGRDAAEAASKEPPKRRLCLFSLDAGEGPEAADCIGNEPIWHDGEVVGWVTSGGFAHHSGLSMALGYVPDDVAASEGPWEIEVLGRRREASRLSEPPFDPSGSRMRA
jgi:dimethylglycine dehydrogenase